MLIQHRLLIPIPDSHDVDLCAVCWVPLCCRLDRLCRRGWGSHHAVDVHLHRRRFALGHLMLWVPPSSPPIPSSSSLRTRHTSPRRHHPAPPRHLPLEPSHCRLPILPRAHQHARHDALAHDASPDASSLASTHRSHGIPMSIVVFVDCVAAGHPRRAPSPLSIRRWPFPCRPNSLRRRLA